MHKVYIKNYKLPDKSTGYTEHRLYSVYLNGCFFKFKTHKQTLKFLADINRLLNEWLLVLNKCNCDLYKTYRYVFFSIDYYDTEGKQFLQQMNITQDLFNRFLRDTVAYDGFRSFDLLILNIEKHLLMVAILDKLLIRIRADSLRYELKLIKKALDQLLQEIDLKANNK